MPRNFDGSCCRIGIPTVIPSSTKPFGTKVCVSMTGSGTASPNHQVPHARAAGRRARRPQSVARDRKHVALPRPRTVRHAGSANHPGSPIPCVPSVRRGCDRFSRARARGQVLEITSPLAPRPPGLCVWSAGCFGKRTVLIGQPLPAKRRNLHSEDSTINRASRHLWRWVGGARRPAQRPLRFDEMDDRVDELVVSGQAEDVGMKERVVLVLRELQRPPCPAGPNGRRSAGGLENWVSQLEFCQPICPRFLQAVPRLRGQLARRCPDRRCGLENGSDLGGLGVIDMVAIPRDLCRRLEKILGGGLNDVRIHRRIARSTATLRFRASRSSDGWSSFSCALATRTSC